MVRTAAACELNIAGVTPFSTVDWPDMMTATVFLQGCPWSCFYCHNPALIDPRAEGAVSWADVTDLLCDRMGLLDGVVFSGGEPTLQHALVPAMQMVRSLGFRVLPERPAQGLVRVVLDLDTADGRLPAETISPA